MIEGIKEIGEYLLAKSGKSFLDIEIEDPNPKGKYPKVVKIVFDYTDGISYKKISIEDYKRENIRKYLYAKKGSRGANYSPTAIISKPIEDVFKNRIETWCNNYWKKSSEILNDEEKHFLISLISSIKGNRVRIVDELEEKTKGVKEGKFITFTFVKGEEELYLGDLELFRKFLLMEKEAKYISCSGKGVCSLCNKQGQVFGDTGVLKFYSRDKYGFVAGGALPEFAFKDFPLCFECLQKVREGKSYRDRELDFSFYGYRYYLIPKLAFVRKGLMERALNIIKKYRKTQILKDGKQIEHEEERLLGIAQELEDYISFTFEFYDPIQKGKGGEKILLLLEEILPSKVVKLFKLKTELEKIPSFQNNGIQFDFLSNFFRMPGDKRPRHKDYFFTLVEAAFKGKLLSKEHLLNLVMQTLRPLFVEEKEHTTTLRAFITFLFYQRLGLLGKKGGEIMVNEPYQEFFSIYEGFFNTPIKRAVFLLGVLTEKLLNYQWRERGGAKPFRKSLKSLRMSVNDLRGLLPKVQGKFMEYDIYDYPELRGAISHYFLQAGENWNIGEDELNFCFVLGMNLESEEPFNQGGRNYE